MKIRNSITVILIIISSITSCNKKDTSVISNENETVNKNPKVLALMKEFKVKGIGLGIIKNGVLVKTEYYGEQGPNIPVSDSTMFNVASITKAITTETFLRLAAKGEVSLDEHISNYYVHADIVDDSRHKLLTPRIILTHKTGFRNWPYEYEDGKLAFDRDPGSKFGYSGVGFYILAKFLEEKMETTFPHLVEEIIFKPLNMKNTSIVQEEWFNNRCPIPADKEGKYMEPYDNNTGYWNPADDLHISVEDYSKFLISTMNNQGLTEALVKDRENIASELMNDPIFGTKESDKRVFYPPTYGYGLGWMVFDYGDGNKNFS